MLKRFEPSKMTYQEVQQGVETSCMIPIGGTYKVNLEVRSPEPVMVNVVTADGEIIPLEHGMIVRWSGKLEECSAVEVVASTSFWFLCQKQGGWFETVDPTPIQVELKTTQEDIIRTMIDERLRRYQIEQNLQRDLTEDEKDELVLDIVHGDLEFDDTPDQFGLGYEERLAEFEAGKQSEPAPAVEPVAAASPAASPVPAAPSSST